MVVVAHPQRHLVDPGRFTGERPAGERLAGEHRIESTIGHQTTIDRHHVVGTSTTKTDPPLGVDGSTNTRPPTLGRELLDHGPHLGVDQLGDARQRLAHDVSFDAPLQRHRRVLQIAAAAAPRDVRTRSIDALGIGFDHRHRHGAGVVARLTDDVDVHHLAGQRALDEHHPTVVESPQTVALGDHLVDPDAHHPREPTDAPEPHDAGG